MSCSGASQQVVSFKYETKNTEAVDPEVDGQAVGAQAGYDPKSGTMRFPYVCPGPHTLTISATGDNQTVSKSQKVGSTGGGKPQVVTFQGPTTVQCSGTQTVTVSFQYEAQNAAAVEPEIDGQPVPAQAGYDPKSGTMRFAYECPGPHTLTIVASAAGTNGQSATKSVRVTSTGGGSAAPQILEFNGPDTASCGTSADTVTLSYSYRTKGATAVEPEIDGQNPGAQAGYPPVHGVMRFNYVCPGPHTLTITAFGKNNTSTSKSIDVAPASAG